MSLTTFALSLAVLELLTWWGRLQVDDYVIKLRERHGSMQYLLAPGMWWANLFYRAHYALHVAMLVLYMLLLATRLLSRRQRERGHVGGMLPLPALHGGNFLLLTGLYWYLAGIFG